MADLQSTFCFAHPTKDAKNFTVENSLDGQPFRSPIFSPMNGCAAGQALPAGECREPQLQGCSRDPWGYTAGQQGCSNSTLCSPVANPRSQFFCTNGTCQTLPSSPGCEAPAFRKTFPGNVVKSNYHLPNVQTIPYRLPSSEVPPSKPFCWTVNRTIKLLRSQKPGFDITMYNRQ